MKRRCEASDASWGRSPKFCQVNMNGCRRFQGPEKFQGSTKFIQRRGNFPCAGQYPLCLSKYIPAAVQIKKTTKWFKPCSGIYFKEAIHIRNRTAHQHIKYLSCQLFIQVGTIHQLAVDTNVTQAHRNVANTTGGQQFEHGLDNLAIRPCVGLTEHLRTNL